MKELMISLFHLVFLKYLQLLQLTKSEFGMVIIGNSYWEFKYQACSATVYFSCMMESQLFLAGLMGKLELSYLNLANYCMWLMMLIITDAHLWLLHLMVKGLSLVVQRAKLEFGELLNKLKLWKPLLKSTEDKFGQYKLIKTIPKLSVQVAMDHVLFGTWRTTQEYYAYSNQLLSSKLLWTLKNIKS